MAESEITNKAESEITKKAERCMADATLKLEYEETLGGGGGGVGFGLGIIFSLIVFKRRSWPITFGTGLGLGMAYANCQNDFHSPYLMYGKFVKDHSP
ncbi:MICOS complex subunit MIC10 isoform X1 [Scyliorhinus torazame]|uniref:MICOS complex subunit MIC10 isoform X1 n=1 Tax=Scyliorhinus torazame TaxID=75743 RepID=UPI003B5B46C1